jgi:CubicO group peptidase (beta-lactamase class C family)
MKKIFPILLLLILLTSACQNTEVPAAASATIPAASATLPQPTNTLIPPTHTPIPSIDDRVAAFQELVSTLDPGEFSGAVLVAYQGTPIYQAAFGLADRSLEMPNQIDTIFNLGSLDKMFTAVAIMQLVELGQIALDDVIGVYLPDYPVPEVAETVTIHHLLTHTSGLGSYFDSPLYDERYEQIRSLDDYFELFADSPLIFPPGAQWGYSNSGYIVLGLIIEAVSGQNYYDYVQEHIFAPSGMQHTACYELDAGTPNLAIGYTIRDSEGNETNEIRDNGFALPMRGGSAGGGYSTTQDLLAFGNALLGYELLNQESTETMLEGKVDLRENVQYAYGFFDMLQDGHRRVGHGGGFPGICSILSIYPGLELTVVILSNSDGDCMAVFDVFIESVLP